MAERRGWVEMCQARPAELHVPIPTCLAVDCVLELRSLICVFLAFFVVVAAAFSWGRVGVGVGGKAELVGMGGKNTYINQQRLL